MEGNAMANRVEDSEGQRRGSGKAKRRNRWQGYLFVGPALLVLMVTSIIPIIYVVWMSFHRETPSGESSFAGLSNFRQLFHDTLFFKSIGNTLVYTFASAALGLSAALVLAALLSRNVKGSKWFQILFFLPSVTSEVVTAMMFLWLLDYNFGLFNYVAEKTGFERVQWLLDPELAMLSVVLVGAWRGASYNTPIFLSAIQNIPGDLYEAASIDGAHAVQKFFRITVPMIVPILSYTIIMAFIGSFQMVAIVDILTNGGPLDSTMVTLKYIWRQGFEFNNLNYAATLSLGLLPILFLITWIQMKFSDRRAQ
ncbi:MAG: lactose ABC transporter permease [Cohnella sp.]|nr:MAG: lactose ABC transporter permease [Cohnella sp.]